MSQIHILDGQKDIILDYITAENIISDNHKKSLEDTLETYDFITFANKRFSQYLEKRNRIIIPDEDNSLREFIIFEGQRYRDTEGHKVQVFANASYLELKKASIIYPHSFKGTASQHAGRALNDTGWQAGMVEVSGDITININEHTNPYENLKRIAKEFKAELRFRIEHDGSKVIGRYVDLLERVGDWQGREVTFGKDLDSIRRIEKQDIVTALLGLGPERDDGTRLEVLVEDKEALQRWGRIDGNGKLKHLIEVYEIQSERTEMTETQARQYTRTALDKRINTQVTYETTIVDLEEVAGHENKKIRFGDTIRIKDEKFNPPLYLEARVFEINRSIKSKAKKDIKLGDYIEYTEEEVNTLWEQLKKEIQDRLARLVIATVVSSGGDVFKNGIGTTQLTAKTFVNGHEVDEDASRYEYQWIKFDKDSNQVDGFIETGKTINVTANDIDEKATYRVLIAYGLDVVTTSEYTLTHLYDGAEGKPGKDGEDGKSSYTHVRYSQNANGSGMTTNPTNAVYIGIAITESPVAPTTASDYEWSKIKGDDGVGTPGADGKTSYVHIKYSNDGGKTFTSNNGEDPGDYIGTYTDFIQADSNDVNKYTWAKVKGEDGKDGKDGKPGAQGIPGEPGKDGKTYYTWVKYANTPTSGMSDNPSGKDYIGIAYNKESPTMSTKYSDYTWSLFKGPQGVQGLPGADGEPTYTWVKYADDKDGNGMSDSPDNKKYIGLAFNKKTATESNNASDYQWSLMPQNIKIGGRNLISNGKGDTLTGWSKWGDTDTRIFNFQGSDWIHLRKGTRNEVGVHTPVFDLKANRKYTISFTFRSYSNSGYDLNYIYLRQNQTGTTTVKKLPNVNMGSNSGFVGSISNEGARVWFTFEHDENIDEARLLLAISGRADGSGFLIKELQIEEATMPSDYGKSQEEIDEELKQAKEDAKNAQTTADSKNTIYRQNTQPSTTGRKVGDVWFQTNNDNKMHTFDGTKWNPATFGEQAITAESITALHIKSLNDLNVNDQFIVDKNGNVFFKGNLTGASGTFSGDLQGSTIKGSSFVMSQALGNDDNVGISGTYKHIDERYNRERKEYDGIYQVNSAFTTYRSKTTYTDGLVRYEILDVGAPSFEARTFRTSSNGTATGSFRGNESAVYLDALGIKFYNGGASDTNTVWNEVAAIGHLGGHLPYLSSEEVTATHFNANTGRYYGEGAGVLRIRADNIVSTRFYQNTTTATTNMLRVTSNGVVSRSTSSRRYKINEKTIPLERAKKFRNIFAKTWYDKEFCETYADALNYQDKTELQENYGKEQVRKIPGLIAEDLHDEGLYEYVEYDDEGRPDGISMYAWTPLLELVKDLYNRVEELEYGRSAV